MKSFPERYLDHLKNNPKGYWFKRKLYGWGWVPATKEGWLIILAFTSLIAADTMWLLSKGEIPRLVDFVTFYGVLFFAIAILIRICYVKGEKPRWSWGK